MLLPVNTSRAKVRPVDSVTVLPPAVADPLPNPPAPFRTVAVAVATTDGRSVARTAISSGPGEDTNAAST